MPIPKSNKKLIQDGWEKRNFPNTSIGYLMCEFASYTVAKKSKGVGYQTIENCKLISSIKNVSWDISDAEVKKITLICLKNYLRRIKFKIFYVYWEKKDGNVTHYHRTKRFYL